MAAFVLDRPDNAKIGDLASLIQVSTVSRVQGIDGKIRPRTIPRRQDTGIKLPLRGTGQYDTLFDQPEERLEYQIDGIECPNCNADTLRSDFKTYNVCPQCGKEKLQSGAIWVSMF